MKLFRFMSFREFQKYNDGEVLVNTKNHHVENEKATNSVGFCFFNYAHYKPEEMLHSLTGIVDFSVCAIFETDRNNVRQTRGRYSMASDRKNFNRISFIAKEYCTTKYSKENFKLLKYTIPDWFNWDEWKWREKNETI